MLVFHPLIAPYRIDFFNCLSDKFDANIFLTWRDLQAQSFDYAKITPQLRFTPTYLNKRILGCIPVGIFRAILQFKPHVILVSECGLVSLFVLMHRALTRSSYKVVSMIDDSYDMVCGNQFSKAHIWAERLLIPHFDNLISVDSRATACFQQQYSKGLYFPIISDEVKMRERYRRIFPISERFIKQFNLEGKKTVLFVGRLVDVKNIPLLINAFKGIRETDYRLIVVGDGECRETLIELSRDDSRILFTGRYEEDELYAWYNIAQVFCLPSKQEPFGAVTAEALLGGCWCLISVNAGSQCLIMDGHNGNVFDPQDINQLQSLLSESLLAQKPVALPLSIRPNMVGLRFENEMEKLVNNIC